MKYIYNIYMKSTVLNLFIVCVTYYLYCDNLTHTFFTTDKFETKTQIHFILAFKKIDQLVFLFYSFHDEKKKKKSTKKMMRNEKIQVYVFCVLQCCWYVVASV